MKKHFIKFIVLLFMPMVALTQSTIDWNTLGNNGTLIGTPLLGNYLGTRDPMSLCFRTNSMPRMRIFEVGGDWRDGYVGIGDYFHFIPEAQCQIYNDLDFNFTSFKASNATSGSLRNDGFSFGITGGATNTGRIVQSETWPIEILTHDIIMRMNINFDATTVFGISPVTRIGIPPLSSSSIITAMQGCKDLPDFVFELS